MDFHNMLLTEVLSKVNASNAELINSKSFNPHNMIYKIGELYSEIASRKTGDEKEYFLEISQEAKDSIFYGGKETYQLDNGSTMKAVIFEDAHDYTGAFLLYDTQGNPVDVLCETIDRETLTFDNDDFAPYTDQAEDALVDIILSEFDF